MRPSGAGVTRSCVRADRENAQVLAGDDRRVYGEFPPDWTGPAGVRDGVPAAQHPGTDRYEQRRRVSGRRH